MVNTVPNTEQLELQKSILMTRHKEELKQTDMKLVIQLDQKVLYVFVYYFLPSGYPPVCMPPLL